MSENKLVTKELLAAFGEKAKKIFRRNPFVYTASTSAGVIIAETSLVLGSESSGFNDIYLNIRASGLDSSTNTMKNVNTNAIFHVNTSSYTLLYGEASNLGLGKVASIMLYTDPDTEYMFILVELEENLYVSGFEIDCIATRATIDSSTGDITTSIISEVITDAYTTTSIIEEDSFEYDYITTYNYYPYTKTPIGYVYNLSFVDPAFTIVKEKNDLGEPIDSDVFPDVNSFDTIHTSTVTKALDHDITFLYDWDNALLSDSDPVTITNPTLASGSTVKIPIPGLLNGGATFSGFVHRVKVQNGIVVDGDTDNTMPLATSTSVGGFLLYNNRYNDVDNPIYVQLTSDGFAFIDRDEILEDKHRDNLNLAKYNVSNLSNYYGKIYLHIGPTTSKYINGYFYKCTHSNYSVNLPSSDAPYTIDINMGSRLENYLNAKGYPIDMELDIVIFVDSTVFSSVETIQEIPSFLIRNSGSSVSSTITREELEDEIGIHIKTTSPWDTATTSAYQAGVMTFSFSLAADGYSWKQWDVQPRTSDSPYPYEYITNSEIDYLFETHVNSLTLNPSNTYIKLYTGDSYEVTATVTPIDADNTTVKVLVSDANIVKYTKNYDSSTGITTIVFEPYLDDYVGLTDVVITTVDLKYQETITFLTNPVDVTGVTLDVSYLDLNEGEGLQVTATVTPTNATDKTVIWESSNEDVATVEDGYVYGVSRGSTIITCTTKDGDYSQSFTVYVQG